MNLPIFKRTYQLYKRLGEIVGYGKIAQISGVTTDTADDWARPVESDEHPTGTGKKNTTDTVLRQIRVAHTKDKGLARQWAGIFTKYVDHLDELAGIEKATTDHAPLCLLIGESATEHLDIVLAFMNAETPDFEQIEIEVIESISKLNELLACVRESAKLQISERVIESKSAANPRSA